MTIPIPIPNPMPTLIGSAFGPVGATVGELYTGLTETIDEAQALFGDHVTSGAARPAPDLGHAPPQARGQLSWRHPHPDQQGPAADAERKAADDLDKKTADLKSLDDQLDGLSKQIVDQNDDAKTKLTSLKSEIDKELDYVKTSKDTSVVKDQAVSKFLQDKATEVAGVLTSAADSISKNKQNLNQIGGGYNTDPGLTSPPAGGDPTPGAAPGGGGGDPLGGGGYGGGGGGYGDGSDDEYGDEDGGGSMGDLAGMLPQAASMLPQALGGLGGGMGGGGGLGDLGSLLSSAVQNAKDKDKDKSADDDKDTKDTKDSKDGKDGKDQPAPAAPAAPPASPSASGAAPAGGAPAAVPPPPAPPAPTLVTRPDGTPATASTTAAAAAARAHLGGADLTQAYKDAKITLPPLGSSLKDTVPPSATGVGDLAAFKDRFVMMLGDGKVYLDGKEQPLAALAKLPGFLGFFHPAAPADSPVSAPVGTGGAADHVAS